MKKFTPLIVLALLAVLLWPIFGPNYYYYQDSSRLVAYYFFALTIGCVVMSVFYFIWMVGVTIAHMLRALVRPASARMRDRSEPLPRKTALATIPAHIQGQGNVQTVPATARATAKDGSDTASAQTLRVLPADEPGSKPGCVPASRQLKPAWSQYQSTYGLHRALTEAEMNLSELFERLSAKGVDSRRDRMVGIMKEAESCRPAATISIDRGGSPTQETARGIINSDKDDQAKFRKKRGHCRINAFVFEAVLKGHFVAARNHVLDKQLEALAKNSELPRLIPVLANMLDLDLHPTAVGQVEAAIKARPDFGPQIRALWLVNRIWQHPAIKHTEKLPDGTTRVLTGWEALEALRKV
jgi:hypothetical protein